ncbi:MAG: BolA family transcriptional regulator [Rhodobacteraceae bacterium]|nr:BolA family transcriptional regulator [Paracoccaceae bacterium]TVR44389.1 MAG: BolA family transcriptional regulator [Paracoccaceae bacterium]
MRICEEIETRLRAAFRPTELQVEDDSESHRGHSGWREGGETHFNVRLRAPEFATMSRVARHRAVHAALGPELVGRIHALALDIGA